MAKKGEYHFQPRLPDGSRPHYRFRTKAEKNEFVEHFKLKLKRIKLGLQETYDAPTISVGAKAWLVELEDKVARNKLTLPAFNVYEQHMRNHILPVIGGLPMDQLTPIMAEEFLKGLAAKGLGPASQNRIRSTLRLFYKRSIQKRLVAANPIDAVEKEDEESARPEPRVLETIEQAATWLDTAYGLGPLHGILASLLLNTGARKSQLIALRFKDYDPEGRTIWMGRIFEEASRTIVERTKGRKKHESFYVGVNDALAKALELWRTQSQFTEPDDFILCLKKGKHLDPDSFDKRHNEVRAATGFDVTPHGGRHTYGTLYVGAGSVEGAKEQLGHKSSKTTEAFYWKKIKRNLRVRANVLNLEPSIDPKAPKGEEGES
jgi:integrase